MLFFFLNEIASDFRCDKKQKCVTYIYIIAKLCEHTVFCFTLYERLKSERKLFQNSQKYWWCLLFFIYRRLNSNRSVIYATQKKMEKKSNLLMKYDIIIYSRFFFNSYLFVFASFLEGTCRNFASIALQDDDEILVIISNFVATI